MNRIFFCLLVLLALAAPAAAQGFILPPPGVDTDPATLSIDFHRVNVDVVGQIATTNVSMQFTNNGQRLAEGTFIFPLPQGAAVERLTMTIDDLEIDAQILRADEARAIYNAIVQQYRDPALLEYIGSDVLQASVFPIPPGESRKIDIVYGQALELDNGLFNYIYPLHTAGTSARRIGQMNISLTVQSDQPISNVYSPSHNVAISRPNDNTFTAGFEATNFAADADFSLFYGIQRESIDINLLTYRESADQDGFFMLMVQPPLTVPQADIVPKDVVIVLDQSGSMSGSKWEQAQTAASYVLENLNPQDRFNVILFSTGWRVWSNEMLPAAQVEPAQAWINNAFPEGGTNIYDALSAALDLVDAQRPMNILFLTDGVPTEGIQDVPTIVGELQADAPANARIFAFGVGDDVDTFLLDSLVRDFRGDGSYVRPTERIDEEVASLYNKISSPVLNDVNIAFEGVIAELLYPQAVPALFASEQVTIVGRYRGSADNATITLSGTFAGERVELSYRNLAFDAFPGGQAFIARLWATRRIGDLLNTIRLRGENDELVDSIVNLSIRYGIITPYTSFLIEEDDILTEQGRRAAFERAAADADALSGMTTGASAVDAADAAQSLRSANTPLALPQTGGGGGGGPMAPQPTMTAAGNAMPVAPSPFTEMEAQEREVFGMDEDGASAEPSPANPIQTVGEKTFIWQDGVWMDTTYEPDTMATTEVVFLSDAYFALLDADPQAGAYLALGERVIVVLDGTAYEIVPDSA